MSILLILVAIFFAFAMGTLTGIIVGADSAFVSTISQNIHTKRVCDSCDAHVSNGDAVFCEDCYEEDDKLTEAIKSRDLDIRYKDTMLRQKGWINKPSQEELEATDAQVTRMEKLCKAVDEVTEELGLKMETASLKDSTAALKKTAGKWKNILEREEKLDDLLEGDKEISKREKAETVGKFSFFEKPPGITPTFTFGSEVSK